MSEETLFEKKITFKILWLSKSLLLFWITWLPALLESLSNHIKITNERIIWTHGLISQKDEEIEYLRLKDTSYEQTIIGRIFKFGTITLRSADLSAPVFTFPIEEPKKWREVIRSKASELKDKKGVKYREEM